jgi:hypothetical protein
VHHGGVYTSRYARQKLAASKIKEFAYYHSLLVRKEDIERWSNFLFEIAQKLARASTLALINYFTANGIQLGVDEKSTIESFDAI